jgi:chromosomal replication initiation ATPase DnaA
LRRRVSFKDVVAIVEAVCGRKSEAFMTQRGDWARPLLLWAARQFTGMTLKEIGSAAGGMDYTAVAMAIKRFEQRAATDANLQRQMRRIKAQYEM